MRTAPGEVIPIQFKSVLIIRDGPLISSFTGRFKRPYIRHRCTDRRLIRNVVPKPLNRDIKYLLIKCRLGALEQNESRRFNPRCPLGTYMRAFTVRRQS